MYDTLVKLSGFGWLLSGLLIGVGNRFADGHTGVHSYCSAPLLQRRSLETTAVAFAAAFAVATFRHLLAPEMFMSAEGSIGIDMFSGFIVTVLYCIAALYALYNMIILLIKEHGIESSDSLVSIVLGMMYGGGLMIAGALRPSIAIGFFTITHWNPTLLILMLTVIGMNQLIFYLILGRP